uniref:Nucleoporin NUP35 n=1 Tax=Syphacia muris TaxID=451379 RepID=A0A0N5AZX2_9BILA
MEKSPQKLRSAMSSETPTKLDESANWVMVYGFAPGDAAEVIKIFSRHGIVVAKKLPEEGNWIYLRYTCPIHAQQALSRNAQVFNSRMRLGVLPVKPEIATFGDCSLRDLSMRSERENLNARSRPALNTSSINSPLTINKSPLDTSYRPSRLSNASRAGIRSLSAAYSTADNDYRVSLRSLIFSIVYTYFLVLHFSRLMLFSNQ